MNEDRTIRRAIRALDAGDPQPVIDLAAQSVLPTDAPVVARAWAVADAHPYEAGSLTLPAPRPCWACGEPEAAHSRTTTEAPVQRPSGQETTTVTTTTSTPQARPAITGRWTPICGDCWAVGEPSQYFPEATTYTECSVCGQSAFVVNAHPEVARAAIAAGVEYNPTF